MLKQQIRKRTKKMIFEEGLDDLPNTTRTHVSNALKQTQAPFLLSQGNGYLCRTEINFNAPYSKNRSNSHSNNLLDKVRKFNFQYESNMHDFKILKEENEYFSTKYEMSKKKYAEDNIKNFGKGLCVTSSTLDDLALKYKNKGYKIPNLSDKKNLFEPSPLLMEDNKIEDFYRVKSFLKNDKLRIDKEKDIFFMQNLNTMLNEKFSSKEDEQGKEITFARKETLIRKPSEQSIQDLSELMKEKSKLKGELKKMKKYMKEIENDDEKNLSSIQLTQVNFNSSHKYFEKSLTNKPSSTGLKLLDGKTTFINIKPSKSKVNLKSLEEGDEITNMNSCHTNNETMTVPNTKRTNESLTHPYYNSLDTEPTLIHHNTKLNHKKRNMLNTQKVGSNPYIKPSFNNFNTIDHSYSTLKIGKGVKISKKHSISSTRSHHPSEKGNSLHPTKPPLNNSPSKATNEYFVFGNNKNQIEKSFSTHPTKEYRKNKELEYIYEKINNKEYTNIKEEVIDYFSKYYGTEKNSLDLLKYFK
jgi:hypothetical protein